MRYMRTDQMSLDATAVVLLQAPDVLTREELDDVREWVAIKLRQWERRVPTQTPAPDGEPQNAQLTGTQGRDQ
jgi:hypothetical protein